MHQIGKMKEDMFVKNEAKCIKLIKTSKIKECNMSPDSHYL